MPGLHLALAASLIFLYYLPSAASLLARGASVFRQAELHPGSKILMYLVYLLFFGLSLHSFNPPSASWLNYLGLAPAAAGVLLHYHSIRALGSSYSAGTKLKAGGLLVTSGPYSLCRHPLYSSAGLFFPGLALLLFSPASLVACGLVFAYLAYRIGVEERLLHRKFGRAYAAYSKKVPATAFGWIGKKLVQ